MIGNFGNMGNVSLRFASRRSSTPLALPVYLPSPIRVKPSPTSLSGLPVYELRSNNSDMTDITGTPVELRYSS